MTDETTRANGSHGARGVRIRPATPTDGESLAHLAEVGFKSERWIDVGYWQLML